MWFIVMLVMSPSPNPKLSEAVAQSRFVSHAACMESAAFRAGALTGVGVHGRYLCMYHGEPDAKLETAAKRSF